MDCSSQLLAVFAYLSLWAYLADSSDSLTCKECPGQQAPLAWLPIIYISCQPCERAFSGLQPRLVFRETQVACQLMAVS